MNQRSAVESLAYFGGPPLFDRSRPIGQLASPPTDEFLDCVRTIHERRTLSGDVPFVNELEHELARYHGVGHCVAVANAGLGITMLAHALAKGRVGAVAMPSFSFRGLPDFVRWAGHKPLYCDVDPSSHVITADAIANAVAENNVACVLAVRNFNSGPVDALEIAVRECGIPLFFDSVYAMGNTHLGRHYGASGAAEVFSLHATKLLNGFEGGYVTTDDAGLAELLREMRNGRASVLGGGASHLLRPMLARLNELHAAMALLSLRKIDQVILRNRERYLAYQEIVSAYPGLSLVTYPSPDSNYQMAVLEVDLPWPLSRDQLLQLMRAEGAQVNGYYSPPLHLIDAHNRQAGGLPVTERLASRYLQLPVGEFVSLDDIASFGGWLDVVHRHGEEISNRLKARNVH